MPTYAETIDVGELARAVGRGWRVFALVAAAGTLAALAVIKFAPPKYSASTTLVVHTGNSSTGSLLSRLGGAGGAAGIATDLFSGQLSGPIETELAILSSRAVVGPVVDSLLLQARVKSPRGVPANRIFSSLSLPGSFKARTYTFSRSGPSQFRFAAPGDTGTVAVGSPAKVAGGTMVLRTDSLPQEFEIVMQDREDAITRVLKYLAAEKGGGEIARVTYKGDDSVSAATVPNAIVAGYLARRRTTDRGVNQRRYEFLLAKSDSAAAALSVAEDRLRRQQEASGILDATVNGRIELEREGQLRTSLTELEVESGALSQLIAAVNAGTTTPRQLAAFPEFFKSPAINQLLTELAQIETDRYKLLDTRTEQDPEVMALTQSAKNIESQLTALARSYQSSLTRQHADLQQALDSLNHMIAALPAAAESGERLKGDVLRLGTIYGAIQAQLVEGRLAAITEGGDVRPLDTATPPKKPSFPEPISTMAIGVGGGLFFGAILAAMVGMLGRWVQDPREIERSTGVAAMRLDGGAPLLLGGVSSQTVLVVPVDTRALAQPVARSLAQTALSRSMTATVLDLSGPSNGVDVNSTIARLEQEYGMVVVQLPGLVSESTIAALRANRPVVLVAPSKRIDRASLRGAVDMLRRLEIQCAGVVLSGPERDGILRA